MSKLAYVDMAVRRAELQKKGRKFQVRQELMGKLAELGNVDSIVGFGMDPPDGTFEKVDRDHYAVIRLAGYVTPFKAN